MIKSITKVTKNARENSRKNVKNVKPVMGWPALLLDIENDIRRLKHHRAIVRRKIASGEPWPENENAGTASTIPAVTRNTETV
jgi:hypothetical protein